MVRVNGNLITYQVRLIIGSLFIGRDAILDEIKNNRTLIVVGETGSGKTTQIPQYILESKLHGDGIIAVTQPRRVAAISLAERVSSEHGTAVGSTVCRAAINLLGWIFHSLSRQDHLEH